MVGQTKMIERIGDKMARAAMSAISGLLSGSLILGSMVGVPAFAQYEELKTKSWMGEQIECIALNIYYETRAVSLADAMGVTDVVLNRVSSVHYPNTPCDVIHEGYVPGKRTCQFSWYCDGKSDKPRNSSAWERSRKLARDMYIHRQYIGITEGATHYHATYVRPYWAPTLDRITRIGSHIFYRMKGIKYGEKENN